VKTAHLRKLEARAERVRHLLLPEENAQGEVTDSQARLRDLVKRISGGRELAAGVTARQAVADLVQFLDVDLPEMIAAVRDAEESARQARRELSARAGATYRLVITSDAPLAVESHEVLDPEGEQP
jgi:hypothetical protein